MDDLVEELMLNTEKFRPPFNYGETFYFSESLPLYGAASFKKDSQLHNVLSDKYGEVGLGVDSVLSSIDSLHFVTMAPSSKVNELIQEWLYLMQSYDIVVKPVKGMIPPIDHIIISKLSCFIKE